MEIPSLTGPQFSFPRHPVSRTKGEPPPPLAADSETKITLDDVHVDLERLRSRLTALLTSGLTAVERAKAGGILAQLGDPRKGVGLKDDLPDIDWIEILPGQFQMGGKGGHRAGDGFTCGLIQQPYRLSRYPVTVAQYQVFAEAGGYKKAGQRFWTKAGWKWRQSKEVTSPEDYGTDFRMPNHPQVGVSWFEARAFCQWLTARWRKTGLISKQVSVRLPSEAEWERAARGQEGRAYPWGNDDTDISQRCNMRLAGIGHICAVGLFPTGHLKCSAECLAGNVWEWCRTHKHAYGKHYERKVRADELDEETNAAAYCAAGARTNFLTACFRPIASSASPLVVTNALGFGVCWRYPKRIQRGAGWGTTLSGQNKRGIA